jgi:polyferredoxin
MDLAEGGTILLRDIEALPAALQERLAQHLNSGSGSAAPHQPRVRVIASSQRSLEELMAANMITPALAQMFSERIVVPPLRDRKRDIPELAAYFVKKSARRHNKAIEGLDDPAVRKLVSYDFRIGNIQELKETVERAVVLSDGPLIESQEVFLQTAAVGKASGMNLLAFLGSRAPALLRFAPRILQGFVAVFFVGLLYFCFFGPSQAERNPATLLVWSVWWPALVLSFLLVGRAWCAVCPMAVAGSSAQAVKNFKWRVPDWMKENDMLIVGAGFLLIIWIEEVTGMRRSPFATGLLLLGIGGGAVLGGLLFPRRTWCRHLCPLGGVAGLCSATAAVELRPTADVCAAKCKGHCCYKGDDKTAGCPMFNHVMFVDTNQHCVLCMNCVLSCPESSPRLNLRVPGRELWFGAGAGPQSAALVAMLMGVVTALIFLQRWESVPQGWAARLLEEHRFGFITLTLLVGAALPLVGLNVGRRFLESPTSLWRGMLALAPLVTAGLACYQLGFVPWLSSLHAGLEYRIPGVSDTYGVSFSMVGTVRVALLLYGLLGTIGALWKLSQSSQESADRFGTVARTLSVGGAASYWALLLVLLVGLEA